MTQLVALLLLSASRLFAATSCTGDAVFCAVDPVVESYRQQGILSGSLLIKKAGKQYFWGVGLADDRTQTPNGIDTRFLIASDSKSFVAASVLRLSDEGKLRLEDSLHSFIPEYPENNLTGRNGKPVTLFDLLTHTSGVPEAYDMPEIESRIDRVPLGFSDMLQAVRDKPLRFSPGTRYEYSNTGYVLLGEVVRRVSAETYTGFLESSFLGPLGLSRTSVGFPSSSHAPVARCYDKTPSGRTDFIDENGLKNLADSEAFTDTNIYTTAGDLLSWAERITSGRELSADATRQMLTPHKEDYGFGWIIYTDDGKRKAYEHAGQYDSFQSWMRRYPDNQTTVVWLGNQKMTDAQMQSFFESVSHAAVESSP